MTLMQTFILLCGLAAVLYGLITSRQILSLSSGNEKMIEIAGAIQEGARAYLNRQYMTIGIVGVGIFVLIWIIFGLSSGIGFLIGAFLSGAAGYVGMNISAVTLTSAQESQKPNRLDWTFTFTDNNELDYEGAKLQNIISISGDQISGFCSLFLFLKSG